MSTAEIDSYLAGAPEPHRSTLRALRATLEGLLPEAEQGITYGIPTFSVAGKGVAGFSFSTGHCSYFPMSGSIVEQLGDRLDGYVTGKGSVRFASDEPLPHDLVAALVEARTAEIAGSGR